LAVAYLVSPHKKAIKPRVLFWGLSLQFIFAFLVLKTDLGKVFQIASLGVNSLLEYAENGSQFLFGPLGTKGGPFGVLFAFQVLPIVIFIASLFAILYQIGVMQALVKVMAVAMQKIMGASGAESTCVAASIFMGQTEAPLTIRPFLAGLTMSELFTIMTSGMAHVSGAVMAAYVKIAHVEIKHLLTAVIMTAPATIVVLIATGIATVVGFNNRGFWERWMFKPEAVLRHKQYERMLTSGFLHGDFPHFFVNAYSLWSFGSGIEWSYGPSTFLLIFSRRSMSS